MHVLLVSKKTHLVAFPERYIGSLRDDVSAKNHNDIHSQALFEHAQKVQRAHDEHKQSLEKTLECFSQAKISYTHIPRDEMSESFDFSPFDLVVTLGGDGTLLTVSHYLLAAHSKILGIKSSSYSKGFLCTVSDAEIPDLVKAISKNKIHFLSVNRILAEIRSFEAHAPEGEGALRKTSPVLNEFLFAHSNPAATTRYYISLGDAAYEEHKSSGVWVAAPAGSTAAIFAAGGEQMSLTDSDYQYRVRELFSPPAEKSRCKYGRIDLKKNHLVIKSLCDDAILAADGHHGLYPIAFGDVITFLPGPSLQLGRFS